MSIEIARKVLRIEAEAIERVLDRLDESFGRAVECLVACEDRKITSLMVTDQSGRIIGVIHLHDLWGTEMF